MAKREELFKSMITKFHNDPYDYYVIFKEVGDKVVMVHGEWGESGYSSNQKLPNISVYDSYEKAFDVWSESIIQHYFDDFVLFGEMQDFGYGFTDEEIKLLEEYIKENNLGEID